MSELVELHLSAPVARILETWGWRGTDPLVKDAVPTVARGHNLVAVLPPAPAAAAPILGAVLSRLGNGTRGLVIVPPAAVPEFAAMAYALAAGTSLRIDAALTSARALRELRAGILDLLIASPATVQELLERSALKAESLGVILLGRPELWSHHPVLPALMQDLPLDAQRVILTASASGSADLVERYARKALVVGDGPAAVPAGGIRTATVPWNRRSEALAELVQLLDPARVSIWAQDLSNEAEIRRALPVDGVHITLTTGDVVAADLVIAFDVPTRDRLVQLVGAGDTVVLAPPGTEAYLSGISTKASALRLPGMLEELAGENATDRAAIRQALEKANQAEAVLALAPLFERYDPVRVAGALYSLWKGRAETASASRVPAQPAAPPVSAETSPAIAKMWVSIGKKDGVTPADLVGALTKELRVDRTAVGRIELKDAYCLVELPVADAGRIAQALSGKMIRKVRVTARLDREPDASRPAKRVRTGGGRPRP